MVIGINPQPWEFFGCERSRLEEFSAALQQHRRHRAEWTDSRHRRPLAYPVQIEDPKQGLHPVRRLASCLVQVKAEAPDPPIGFCRCDPANLALEQQFDALRICAWLAWEGAYRAWRGQVVATAPSAWVFRVDCPDRDSGRPREGRYTLILPRPDQSPTAPAPPLVGRWGWADSPQTGWGPVAPGPLDAVGRGQCETWAADYLRGATRHQAIFEGFHLAALTPRTWLTGLPHRAATPQGAGPALPWAGRAWF